ncbi:hypothetical protein F511_32914 [Dorcoceras hygrometricum]|uniref:Uncharacterized protein n=1 Tax=Dorcoceras hygrometricum TaxID=472368 RepID=A0A2Z7AM70_9LAMI|nr:hypothetical protein F511_32914 [Dorcoceras hygrometricum]
MKSRLIGGRSIPVVDLIDGSNATYREEPAFLQFRLEPGTSVSKDAFLFKARVATSVVHTPILQSFVYDSRRGILPMPPICHLGLEDHTRPASRAVRLELGDPDDMCSVREYFSKIMPCLPESCPDIQKKHLPPTSARRSRAPDVVVLARRLR